LKAGAVVEQDIDPIELANRLGVLKPWEAVAVGAVKVREVVVAHRVFRPQQGR
jgi:hypothetical protein